MSNVNSNTSANPNSNATNNGELASLNNVHSMQSVGSFHGSSEMINKQDSGVAGSDYGEKEDDDQNELSLMDFCQMILSVIQKSGTILNVIEDKGVTSITKISLRDMVGAYLECNVFRNRLYSPFVLMFLIVSPLSLSIMRGLNVCEPLCLFTGEPSKTDVNINKFLLLKGRVALGECQKKASNYGLVDKLLELHDRQTDSGRSTLRNLNKRFKCKRCHKKFYCKSSL